MDAQQPLRMGDLPPYEVVCLQMDADREADGHRHVTAVETRDPDGGRTRWTSIQIVAAIRDGERYLVASDGQGNETLLEPAVCPRCPMVTLAVDPPEARPVACD